MRRLTQATCLICLICGSALAVPAEPLPAAPPTSSAPASAVNSAPKPPPKQVMAQAFSAALEARQLRIASGSIATGVMTTDYVALDRELVDRASAPVPGRAQEAWARVEYRYRVRLTGRLLNSVRVKAEIRAEAVGAPVGASDSDSKTPLESTGYLEQELMKAFAQEIDRRLHLLPDDD
jgi:hypothetical protein